MKTTVASEQITDRLSGVIADIQQLAYETSGAVDYADEIHMAINQFRHGDHHDKLVDAVSDYITRVFEIQELLKEDY